jgi:2-amino-4-hydroxy-6-hydroxymethyldihydropteridine diphosphokinase / dihydropteroate synthase
MTTVYLGLGSNLGDRRGWLRRAIAALRDDGLKPRRLSPVVESPAWLPERAPDEWNRPFLNVVLEIGTDLDPLSCKVRCKAIERSLQAPPTSRWAASRWAPREIDIDLLVWGDDIVDLPELRLPRPELPRLGFLLTPLLHLRPDLVLPGDTRTLFEHSRTTPPIPLWMGIFNLTPDSFSDGGEFTEWNRLEPHLGAMLDAGVHILDLGAESTRPGATPLTAEQEWFRLEPVLKRIIDRLGDDPLRPEVSVDTYHPTVAARALAAGATIINDVGGLSDPAMRELASDGGTWVAMHQLGLPADQKVVLPQEADPCTAVEHWLEDQLPRWQRLGIGTDRLLIDPGIGFGKTASQSLALMRGARRLRDHGLRLLIGHSRKSWLRGISGSSREERDQATLGASLALCQQGIDVLRVHNVPLHAAAYRGWAHVRGHD